MTDFAEPAVDAAVLSTADGSGSWTWAGALLSADGSLEATMRYADLSWDERNARVAEEDAAWLAAQWSPPAPGTRFELRYITGPEAENVRAAMLVRVRGQSEEAAHRLTREQLARACDPDDALPPHVSGQPIGTDTELHAWLGYPNHVGSFVEVRKHVSVGRVSRGGTGLPSAACHGFFDSGARWDGWWRRFAKLPFAAALSVGFESLDARDPWLRQELHRRTMELAALAQPASASPLNPFPVPADPAAARAWPGYNRALTRYAGRGFLVRLALVSEQPVPAVLVESLVRTVSSTEGAVEAFELLPAEHDAAVAEYRALGAPWLPASYQRNLPTALDPVDRLLHGFADLTEAAALLSLPVHWPGMPPVFGANEGITGG